jgi:uncharacterized protein
MPVRYLKAHRYVFEAAGRVALARGPILYCIEGVDHSDHDVRDLIAPEDPSQIKVTPSDLLEGMVLLTAQAQALPPDGEYLYRTRSDSTETSSRPTKLTAIPYFAWANRKSSPMQVWVRLHI